MSCRFIRYQNFTKYVTTFSTFNTRRWSLGWHFRRADTCPFINSNQKQKKNKKERKKMKRGTISLVRWLKRAVGLAGFCMTAWYGGTKGTLCHDKPFPLGWFLSPGLFSAALLYHPLVTEQTEIWHAYISSCRSAAWTLKCLCFLRRWLNSYSMR